MPRAQRQAPYSRPRGLPSHTVPCLPSSILVNGSLLAVASLPAVLLNGSPVIITAWPLGAAPPALAPASATGVPCLLLQLLRAQCQGKTSLGSGPQTGRGSISGGSA